MRDDLIKMASSLQLPHGPNTRDSVIESMIDRKIKMLDAGIELATERGIRSITRDEIATRSGVAFGLINKYFEGGIEQVRVELLQYAIRTNNLQVIACAIVENIDGVNKLSQEVKMAAMASKIE